jgi:hypothetical protein
VQDLIEWLECVGLAIPDDAVPLVLDGKLEFDPKRIRTMADEVLVRLLPAAMGAKQGKSNRIEHGTLADSVGPTQDPDGIVFEGQFHILAKAEEVAQLDSLRDHRDSF